jgi:aspartate 1-decarboxylase
MKSKIHRATVTERNLAYSGSLTIDANLMEQADLIPNEKIQVVNINTGVRFETYTIRGEAGSGIIGVNGGAARLAEAGDIILIISYAIVNEEEALNHEPKVIGVDENNRAIKI